METWWWTEKKREGLGTLQMARDPGGRALGNLRGWRRFTGEGLKKARCLPTIDSFCFRDGGHQLHEKKPLPAAWILQGSGREGKAWNEGICGGGVHVDKRPKSELL